MSDPTRDPRSHRRNLITAVAAHRVQVFDGSNVVLDDAIAIGAPATPTPSGTFYVIDVVTAPNPNMSYGSAALALSGQLKTLEAFAATDDQIGIYGTPDAS